MVNSYLSYEEFRNWFESQAELCSSPATLHQAPFAGGAQPRSILSTPRSPDTSLCRAFPALSPQKSWLSEAFHWFLFKKNVKKGESQLNEFQKSNGFHFLSPANTRSRTGLPVVRCAVAGASGAHRTQERWLGKCKDNSQRCFSSPLLTMIHPRLNQTGRRITHHVPSQPHGMCAQLPRAPAPPGASGAKPAAFTQNPGSD